MIYEPAIIPPVKQDDTFMDGLVKGSDALSEEFINNEYIMSFVNDPNCTIIVYENPPYAETSSIEHQKAKKGKESSNWKKSKAVEDSKIDLKSAKSNDMANVFIWSAFNYYLKKKEDSLIVFSPIKYWKNANWLNKKFEKGFAFNRRHFHTTTDTVVTCILWSNENVINQDKLHFETYDIKDNQLVKLEDRYVKRVNTLFSQSYYDLREFPNDIIQEKPQNGNRTKVLGKTKSIWINLNGTELLESNPKIVINSKHNENIIGYLIAQSNTFELPRASTTLIRQIIYNAHGFYLRADNFLEKLPMFASGWWSTYNEDWTLNGIVYRSGDGKQKFEKDLNTKYVQDKLHKILFYTCLEYYNKIRSLNGSDGRLYKNELCLDNNIDHNNYQDILMKNLGSKTLAYKTLEDYHFFANINEEEKTLLELWGSILEQIKNCKEYNPNFNYGPFQIENELNTFYYDNPDSKNKKKIFNYPKLNGDLKTLRVLIKQYYKNYIQDFLFEYEFLK